MNTLVTPVVVAARASIKTIVECCYCLGRSIEVLCVGVGGMVKEWVSSLRPIRSRPWLWIRLKIISRNSSELGWCWVRVSKSWPEIRILSWRLLFANMPGRCLCSMFDMSSVSRIFMGCFLWLIGVYIIHNNREGYTISVHPSPCSLLKLSCNGFGKH